MGKMGTKGGKEGYGKEIRGEKATCPLYTEKKGRGEDASKIDS